MIKKPFKIIDAREVYAQLGTFSIRAVVDSDFDADLAQSTFSAIDSSGKKIETSSRVWGNKLKCLFTIDENVSDGVAIGNVVIAGKDRQIYSTNVYFWVIK